ncbi:hypothetical protein [Treponema sp. R80B11-R83G3]
MKNNETPEILLDRIYHSAKAKKLVIILVLTCIIICIIPLLPSVQNALFSFIDAHISRKGKTSGVFENRLRSLLSLPFFGLVVFVMALCCLFYKTVSKFLEDAKNTRLDMAQKAKRPFTLLKTNYEDNNFIVIRYPSAEIIHREVMDN